MVICGPVAAYSPPTSDYGNTATCRYKAPGDGPSYQFRIKKLVVTPPVLYGTNSTHNVGWRFVVTRSKASNAGPWKVTYRSPIEKAPATTSQPADFHTKSVDVSAPDVDNVVTVWYHVTLKLYQYSSGGAVLSVTSYQMPYIVTHTKFADDWANECTAGFYQGQ